MSRQDWAIVIRDLKLFTTQYQKDMGVFTKAIGEYTYTVEYINDYTYNVIKRKPIPDAITELYKRDDFKK